jgi:DUF4097 and DUF4098 domain-containing protein YvlB
METVFPTPGGVDLEIHIPAGAVQVRCEARDDTAIEIRGERDPDEVRVERVERPGGRWIVRIEQRNRKMFGFGRDLQVSVQAPEGAAMDVATGSADLKVSGGSGSIAFRSGSGELAFERAAGDVSVKVASGDVRGHRVDGDLTVHSASGDVEVGSVGGSATATTASGDISIGAVGGPADANSASGDVRIGAISAGSVHARTMSGDVAVGVTRGTRVWLDLTSVSGQTVSELAAADGIDGDAAADLHLSSVSGDIRVHRAAVPA